MKYFTAEYTEGEDKTFQSETGDIGEAVTHAKSIGYGRKVACVREATDGEADGCQQRHARNCEALSWYTR